MRRLNTLFLAAAFLLSGGIAAAADVQFGSLQLSWLEGFSPITAKPPFELKGPAGEKVLVTVMSSGRSVSTESAKAEQEKIAGVGNRLLREQGEKAGKVVIPLSRSVLVDGSLLLFMGSETTRLFSAGYFLQYLVVSTDGRLGFFTIEGKGDPEEQHARFLPVIKTAIWLP